MATGTDQHKTAADERDGGEGVLALSEVVGQERAVSALLAGYGAGRSHHAFIFHGPSGVGKRTTAMAFARLLLCHGPETDLMGRVEACGGCGSCVAIRAGGHPDMHLVVKELAQFSDDSSIRNRKLTSIPVEVLREAVLEPVSRAAVMGENKVVVIDEAELLNGAGQNLLLKTLEEPPAGTYLILVTSQEERLLPTIRSRCQRVGFGALPEEAVLGWLRETADYDEKVLAWLARFSGGSLGRAAVAVGYDLVEWGRAILPEIARASRGEVAVGLGADMSERIDGFAKAWVAKHKGASKEAANRMAAGLMFHLITDQARAKLAEAAAGCDAGDPIVSEASLEPWLRMIDAVGRAEGLLGANVNLSLVCDELAFGMAGGS